MQNRLIAAFGAPVSSRDASPRRNDVSPLAFLKVATAHSPAAWRNFFSRRNTSPETPMAPRVGKDSVPPFLEIAALFDALGEIAVTRTRDGRIVAANATLRAVSACDRPEGLMLQQLGFRPRSPSDQANDLAVPAPAGRDLEIAGPDGRRIFLWRDVVVEAPDGSVLVHGLARDVTAERLAREEQEIARLKAEARTVAKSRQLATAVHEIRTPLNGILGMGQLLDRTQLTPEQQNYIGGMRQAGQALAQLVDDLLDHSTMEAGRFKLNTRAENLRQLIESVVEMLAPRAHEKNLEIGAVVMADLPDLHDFDPARLRQVLFNVIGNAVKFTQAGGVLVRVWPEGRDVVITVADTGPGMTTEEQSRIFGEFEQAGCAETRSGGTGLGMAISHRIVGEFGGTLSVESRPGEGSTFTMRLPLVPTESAVGEAGGLQSPRTEALRPSRVLLLAPQGPSSDAIIAMIETLGGVCRQAGSNAEAERLIAEAEGNAAAFTDLIVDHRLAGDASGLGGGSRRILLVNPEERGSQPQELYHAWLIRPLRERTLIDVLRGRLGSRESSAHARPNKPAAPPFPQLSLPAPAAPALPSFAGSGLTIVLAEDDAVNAMLYSTVLRRAGHSVTHVVDFPAMLAAACGEAPPDLVISDMHMPGGEITSALKDIAAASGRRGRSLPVIILSGESRGRLLMQAVAAGAADVMQKPVAPDTLLAALHRYENAAMRQAS